MSSQLCTSYSHTGDLWRLWSFYFQCTGSLFNRLVFKFQEEQTFDYSLPPLINRHTFYYEFLPLGFGPFCVEFIILRISCRARPVVLRSSSIIEVFSLILTVLCVVKQISPPSVTARFFSQAAILHACCGFTILSVTPWFCHFWLFVSNLDCSYSATPRCLRKI